MHFNLFIATKLYIQCCSFAWQVSEFYVRSYASWTKNAKKLYDPFDSDRIRLHSQKVERIKNIFSHWETEKYFRFSAFENFVAYSRSIKSDLPDVIQPPSAHSFVRLFACVVPNKCQINEQNEWRRTTRKKRRKIHSRSVAFFQDTVSLNRQNATRCN